MSKHIKNLKITLLALLVVLLGALMVIQFVLPAEDNPFSRGLASILGDGSEEVVVEVVEEVAPAEIVPLPDGTQDGAQTSEVELQSTEEPAAEVSVVETSTVEAAMPEQQPAETPAVETPAVEASAQEQQAPEQPAEDPNKDTDKDGIVDSLDQCPWTFGAKVDSDGCRIKEPVKLTWPTK